MIRARLQPLILALAMLVGAGLAEVARPTVKLADQAAPIDLQSMFPREFGSWRVDSSLPAILPSPDVQAKLDKIYNQVLSRTYINSEGARVMLSVAYGGDQSDGTSAHRPDVCYPAQGFQVTGSKPASLELGGGEKISARTLYAHLGARHEPITYWIVVGDSTVTSGSAQKWVQLRYGVRGLIPDGMLVRVSSIDNDEARAQGIHGQFVRDLHGALPFESRARVFGTAAGQRGRVAAGSAP